MKFSEYVVTENTGSSVDPLGFLRPSSALADGLFKQFTVLSNNPAYLGFLTFAFQYLASIGKRPGTKGFSEDFRDAESLWGVLNDRANVSILNVTKYAEIAKKIDISLLDVRKYRPLYARLNYGTLGHYSSPAIFWGLLDRKGIYLTDLGNRLGQAWSVRAGINFTSLMEAWLSHKDASNIANFAQASIAFNLTAPPSNQERATWREVIRGYCARNLVIEPLWRHPVSTEILAFWDDEHSYPGYYPAIQAHYNNDNELKDRIGLAHQFERLAALALFVFEWEYVKRLDEVKEIGLHAPKINMAICNQMISHADAYTRTKGYKDAGKLFQVLAQEKSYDGIASSVLSHHKAHQKSKGASPFIQGDVVLIQDRVDPNSFSMFLEELRNDSSNIDHKITWRHRRDWHFKRASTWLSYAGGFQ